MTEQPIFESPQEKPEQPTPEKSIEQRLREKKEALEGLAERLGFKESPEMVELRKMIGTPEGINREALVAWRDLVDGVVGNAAQGEEFVCAQVAHLILKATVYLDANMPDEFYEDLDDIVSYVAGTGIDFGDRLKLLDVV